MLIRSQCKEQLINFNHISSFEIVERTSGEAEIDAMYSFNDADFGGQAGICLGDYSTKEKAILVLDQIQEAYRVHKRSIYSGFTPDPIFYMPEDKDVN